MKKYIALLIKPDNTIEEKTLDQTEITLDQLRTWVDVGQDPIQIIRAAHCNSLLIVIDDCGKLPHKHKPVNLIATALYGNPQDFIVGNALICQEMDDQNEYAEPDTYGIPEKEARALKKTLLDLMKA